MKKYNPIVIAIARYIIGYIESMQKLWLQRVIGLVMIAALWAMSVWAQDGTALIGVGFFVLPCIFSTKEVLAM